MCFFYYQREGHSFTGGEEAIKREVPKEYNIYL